MLSFRLSNDCKLTDKANLFKTTKLEVTMPEYLNLDIM